MMLRSFPVLRRCCAALLILQSWTMADASAASGAKTPTANKAKKPIPAKNSLPTAPCAFSGSTFRMRSSLTQRRPRTYVSGIVREGAHVFTNVGIHLKGMGSFRSVDEKPSLVLKFDELFRSRIQRTHQAHAEQLCPGPDLPGRTAGHRPIPGCRCPAARVTTPASRSTDAIWAST